MAARLSREWRRPKDYPDPVRVMDASSFPERALEVFERA
jgi:hypothetical protein